MIWLARACSGWLQSQLAVSQVAASLNLKAVIDPLEEMQRAAVLVAKDGLVSILSLVMGVAGATGSNSAVLIAALAGRLAGDGSMALGEWLSVQSSRELYEHRIKI
jgi:hypothetical protein